MFVYDVDVLFGVIVWWVVVILGLFIVNLVMWNYKFRRGRNCIVINGSFSYFYGVFLDSNDDGVKIEVYDD